MKTENITLFSDGLKLAAALDLPERNGKLKFIVACHGLFSTKDSDKWRSLGHRLTGAGYGLLRLDFRGCGESEGSIEETTVSGRLEDLSSALDYVNNHPAFSPPIGLVGSSLGGLLVMAEASANNGIGALAAMATPALITASPEIASSLKEIGYYQYPEFRMGKGFWEDGGKYSLATMASSISCPTLLIHGEKDEQVPLVSAPTLFDCLKGDKKLEVIAGGDHRFSDPAHREKVIDLIVGWFTQYLAP